MSRAVWESIKKNHFALCNDMRPESLIRGLMEGLGDPDPETRDALAYAILAHWINGGYFRPSDLREIAGQCVSNLQVDAKHPESDQVFRRSFSILVLGEVIAFDVTARFLQSQEVKAYLSAGLKYMEQEQDLRGYVSGKGWAHSCAHSADFVRIAALHPELDATDHIRMLDTIAKMVTADTIYPYLANEEDRLAVAVTTIIHRGLLPLSEITDWLEQLAMKEPWAELFVKGQRQAAYHNAKALLMSLHFLISQGKFEHSVLLSAVRKSVSRMNPWEFGL